MKTPFVSVLMTAFNREMYLDEAIDSVLKQTYTNFELIVVDDCSSDSTVEIANKYANLDGRVKVFLNKENLGDYPNRNKAASLARGDFLMSVDSDDSIKSDAIEHIIGLFGRFPCSDFLTLNRDSFYTSEIEVLGKDLVRRDLLIQKNLYFGPGATVIRYDYFKKIGGFPTRYGPANDMYYNIKAANNTNVIICKYEFLNYRIHNGQEQNNKFSYLHNGYKYFGDILTDEDLPLTKNEIQVLYFKNKRRFVINMMKYLMITLDYKKSLTAVKMVKFTLKDLREAIFLK
jgi:glycosyltransferase involved in cell wall biosynthesis